jgi:S-layer homology domain.
MNKKLGMAVLVLFILGIWAGLACAQDNGRCKGQEANNQKNKFGIKNSIKEYADMHNEWSREAVMEATIFGFVNGDEYSHFKPNQPLTKLEAIAMLLNAEGFQDEVNNYNLSDEEEIMLKHIPDWGKNYVAVALQENLLLPDELDNFNPQQGIKRYEVCIYLSRINGDTDIVPQTKQEFKDWSEIPDEYRAIVNTVQCQGLMNGNDEGKFCPNQVVTRCEMAVILDNLEEKVLHRFDSSRIKGVIEEVTSPDIDGDYVITVNTGNSKSVEVDADTDTRIFLDGHEIEPSDIEAGSNVKIILKDDTAVMVKLTFDEHR